MNWEFKVGSTLFYIVCGVGGGILLIAIGLIIYFCTRNKEPEEVFSDSLAEFDDIAIFVTIPDKKQNKPVRR